MSGYAATQDQGLMWCIHFVSRVARFGMRVQELQSRVKGLGLVLEFGVQGVCRLGVQ